MSGPKESHWEIRQQQREEIRQKRMREKARQIEEIKEDVRNCRSQIAKIHVEHGHYADYLVSRIEGWLDEVLVNSELDTRLAWRGLKGARIYLETQKERLKVKAEASCQQRLMREKRIQEKQIRQKALTTKASESLDIARSRMEVLREDLGVEVAPLLGKVDKWINDAEQQIHHSPEKVMHSLKGINTYLDSHKEDFNKIQQSLLNQEKAERILVSLEAIREDFQVIMNSGIEQRIVLFSKAIKTNPDNLNTIKQIDTFRTLLRDEMEKYDEKQAQLAHVQQVFSEALGAEPTDGDNGSVVISGNIEGVPIQVCINRKNSDIRFDTPTDGSCRSAMNALTDSLQGKGVGLGPIRILNTGESINSKFVQVVKPLNNA